VERVERLNPFENRWEGLQRNICYWPYFFIQSFCSSRRYATLHSTFLIGKLAVELTLVEFLFLEVISAKIKALMMKNT